MGKELIPTPFPPPPVSGTGCLIGTGSHQEIVERKKQKLPESARCYVLSTAPRKEDKGASRSHHAALGI